jgi:hypothetical protein
MIIYFKQDNRKNWGNIHNNLIKVIGDFKGDCQVEVKPLKKKRSGNQLKAYWALMSVVHKWMIEQGNVGYNLELLSDWFKVRSGYYILMDDGIKIPKSISNKSDCSVEQMEAIINTILEFGREFGIPNCEIEDRELQELLKYYK